MLGLVPHAEAPQAVDAMHERLALCRRGQFQLGDVSIDDDGPSIGVVAASDGVADPAALLALADTAMYAAKRQRRALAGIQAT